MTQSLWTWYIMAMEKNAKRLAMNREPGNLNSKHKSRYDLTY